MLQRRYQLYVKMDHRWQWCCEILAESHEDAFRKAVMCIGDDHLDKPIRLEQDEAAETT
jgi:hypothetical protein